MEFDLNNTMIPSSYTGKDFYNADYSYSVNGKLTLTEYSAIAIIDKFYFNASTKDGTKQVNITNGILEYYFDN